MVVTELQFVESRWGGGGTGFRPGEPRPTAARLADGGEGAGARMRAMPEVLLAVREGARRSGDSSEAGRLVRGVSTREDGRRDVC